MCIKKFILAAVLSVFAIVPLHAQTKTNQIRSLTLEEAIQLAIQNNLDVQIERYNPRIARFNLEGVYGDYDPVFGVRAVKSFVSSPGGFSSVGLDVPSNETDRETVEPSLSGTLPTGLRYNIGGDVLSRSGGTRSATRTTITTNLLGVPIATNTVLRSVDRGTEYTPGVGIDLAQPLLKDFWIDGTRQRILANKNILRSTEMGVRNRIMFIVNSVEQAYYNLIFQRENVRVQEAGLLLAERLLAENKRRVEVGALAPLDEKQAESQAAGSRANLLIARQNLQAQENVLKNLITDKYADWHDISILPMEKLIAIPQEFNLLESWERGLAQRPDLLQTRLDIERRDILLRYQRNQLFPQLDLIGSYGRNALDRHWGGALESIRDETNPEYSYGILFSIPLSNRGPRNLYRATQAEKEQALLVLKQLEQRIMVEIDDSVKLAQTSFERVGATRQARLYAESALEAEQKKLENGKSTSFIVLQLQRDLTTARSEEIRALADYNQALAQLAFNEGTVFERNNLSLDIK